MRSVLETLYRASLSLSAACLVAIAALVGLQLAGRIADGVLALAGFPVMGLMVLSLAEICGYLLAAASFLALAPTLKAGAHIRVTMVLGGLSARQRRLVELWAFGASAAASAYLTYHLARFAWFSFLFHEVSAGVVRVPLAYPQSAMAIGALILTIALIDETCTVLQEGTPTFRAREDAVALGKEG